MARDGDGLLWKINGTQGDIRLKGPMGHLQLAPLTIEAARGDEKAFQLLEVPASCLAGLPLEPVPNNVARNYARLARDLREGTHTAPTFDDAVAAPRDRRDRGSGSKRPTYHAMIEIGVDGFAATIPDPATGMTMPGTRDLTID